MRSQTIEISKKTMLRKSTFYKKGYVFQGWALSKKGKVKYKDKCKIKNLTSGGKKIKLYAKWKKDGTRRAIIIGETSSSAISEYTMIQMQETILHSKFYGRSFSKDLVYYYANRTKDELKKYIPNVCKNNKANDITYIYIVCHGMRNGDLYVYPNQYFTPQELRNFLDDNVKGKIVLFMESCFSASFVTKSETTEQNNKNNFSENFITNFIQAPSITTQQIKSSTLDSSRYKVICSSDEDESSLGGKISLATKYWNYGAGWNPENAKKCKLKADKNKDEKVTLNELYKYSYKKVKEERNNQHICVYPKNSSFIVFGRFNY